MSEEQKNYLLALEQKLIKSKFDFYAFELRRQFPEVFTPKILAFLAA
jgi:hypothetical protein